MQFIADFHIHSKYSRATSKDMDVEHLAEWSKLKGVDLIGTGDFTHHLWLEELKSKLESKGNGLFIYPATKKGGSANNFGRKDVNFILTTEISSIYSKRGKTYRIHNVIFAPSFEVVDKINNILSRRGNLSSDGRPILGVDAEELAHIVFDVDESCMLVPGHIWTPWFSLFGSMSGFDRIEDCFEKETNKIFALETGLSSDPAMNWRLSKLDRFSLISNSDSHCVHPDTFVYKPNGEPIAIKDLNPSDVACIDFKKDMKQYNSKVAKLHRLPSPPILYRITTRKKNITVTPEHRFFVLENGRAIEKKAFELKKGELVSCLRKVTYKGKPKRLPQYDIDHEVEILHNGIDYLRARRTKNKKTQKDIAMHIGVNEDCVWIFEKYKVKTPKETFIDKYCEYLGIDRNEFKNKFITFISPAVHFPEFTSEKFCQILGYILGDGGIETYRGKLKGFSLTDKDSRLLLHYNKLIKEIFNIDGKRRKKKGKSNSIRYPAYLADYFKYIAKEVLVGSTERKVPKFIFDLPNIQVAVFLKGLFDAEGCIGNHWVDMCSSSLFLVQQIQALLLRFEISSYIYSCFEKNKKKWRYRLTIFGQDCLRKFRVEIGFDSISKKEKLHKYLSSLKKKPKNSFVDYLPLKHEILKAKKLIGVSCYDIPKRLYYHLAQENTLRRDNVKEFIEIFSKYSSTPLILKEIKRFAESDIIWEQIQEAKKMKSDCRYVYDLTVPGYENYVANGFITHNSPSKIGREANVFDCEIDYFKIQDVLRTKDKTKFLYTIEFFPQEGKYHFDGHRVCKVCFSPKQSKESKNRCPKCGRLLTIGVMNRIEQLADRPEGAMPDNVIPFKNLIPLDEIIAEAKGLGKGSLTVGREYRSLIGKFGNEFEILLNAKEEDLRSNISERIAEGILRVRQGKVNIRPGFDGEYGKISIFGQDELEKNQSQTQLDLF